MKSKLNPVSIGSFVIGGVILLAVGLISFQSLNFFNKPLRFTSYFDESVQGLDIGSAVKLRGVPAGRVVAIKVQYDWSSKKSEVAVICELNKDVLADRTGNSIKISDDAILKKLINDGLRAKISLVGITGLQFVQLDFLDPAKDAAYYPDCNSPYPVIPTINSGMSKLTDHLAEIADHLRDINFGELSTNLKSLLGSLNDTVDGVDLKRMVNQVTAAAGAIQRLASFLDQHPSSLIFGRKSPAKAAR